MKCEKLFSGIKKTNTTTFLSVEFVQKLSKVNEKKCMHNGTEAATIQLNKVGKDSNHLFVR